jgi:hypothetical protein
MAFVASNLNKSRHPVLDRSTQSGRHSLAERGDDHYTTPAGVTGALLQAELLPKYVWDPCCGTGAIVTELRAAGHEVIASDLVDYEIPITPPSYCRVDFLLERQAPSGCEGIVCNPPYKLAPQFVRHALALVPFTAMLLRLAFLESTSRTDILEGGQLARVLVFRRRLPMMHRRNWAGKRAGSGICFAWFIWKRDWCGNPQIKRIDITHNQSIHGDRKCSILLAST